MRKEFPLSTPKERIMSVCFCLIVIAAMGLLLYVLRNNTLLLILCALGVLILSVLMVFSVISTFKTKCFVNAETKTLEVTGFPSYTKDLSEAVLLQTLSRKNGHAVTRILIFSDAQENVIASVPTLYTTRQGIWAEPMAKEMAQFLGIDFQQNVPEWEYDKEKYKEHLKEEEAREKAERKERAELRKKKLLYRYRNKK